METRLMVGTRGPRRPHGPQGFVVLEVRVDRFARDRANDLLPSRFGELGEGLALFQADEHAKMNTLVRGTRRCFYIHAL
jgi:hypothetical protein